VRPHAIVLGLAVIAGDALPSRLVGVARDEDVRLRRDPTVGNSEDRALVVDPRVALLRRFVLDLVNDVLGGRQNVDVARTPRGWGPAPLEADLRAAALLHLTDEGSEFAPGTFVR
jgi:hypothetical protein